MLSAKKELFTSGGGYQISRSVRLRSSASAYFNRTPTSTGNQQKWTWSGWVKRGKFTSDYQQLFAGGASGASYTFIRFSNTDALQFATEVGGVFTWYSTSAVFRDPSAWYHIVVAVDTTQATQANRVRIYINGQENTYSLITGVQLAQNTNTQINTTTFHTVGTTNYSTSTYLFDGYLTEINFIDGQALTPSSFGQTNSQTGVWQPIKYTGTYGTNGFYLNFSDNSNNTATTIGKDYSGNGNNWTPNNISMTAGTTYDSMLDVPTLNDSSASNYPVLNRLVPQDAGYTTTISAANLDASITYASGTNMVTVPGTMSTGNSGKWYFEVTATSTQPSGGSTGIGVSTMESTPVATNLPRNSYIYVGSDGSKTSYTGTAVNAAYGASYTTNNVIGVALDIDAGTLTFYKNGASQGTAFTGLAATNYFPIVSSNGTGTRSYSINCGQRPFTYTPPTGFKALNTFNLPDATIKKGNLFFDATAYAGTGSTQNIVNSGAMQPDLLWIKCRSSISVHDIVDSVRGVNKALSSNTTAAELTGSFITSLNSNGFTLPANTTSDAFYTNIGSPANTFVGWQWNAGGSTVTNTDGSISAQVRANPTAGFSVVTYTGTLSGTPGTMPTVGHGLGVTPSLIISKSRNVIGVDSGAWFVWTSATATDNYLRLNTTAATASVSSGGGGTMVAPTSTVFSTPYISGANINANNYVTYCFASVAGYSAFGKYTGNGSADGPFVYLGFRPRFLLIKQSNAVNGWYLHDTSRDTYNTARYQLYPNVSNAENNYSELDILSNGFKIRVSTGEVNTSSGTYIYMAFAENPFKLSLAR